MILEMLQNSKGEDTLLWKIFLWKINDFALF